MFPSRVPDYTLCFLCHGFDELRIYLLLDENAASRRANLALVNEDPKQRSVNSGFPIRILEEYIWRFASKFESDALESVSSAGRDELSDGSTSRKGDLVDIRVRNKRGASSLAVTIHDIYHTRRQANLREPLGQLHSRQRRRPRAHDNDDAALVPATSSPGSSLT